MHHVLGGELLAVMLALGALLEMERPDVLVVLVDLPSLGQHADVVGLFIVVEPETAVDLAPDGVAHRDAVGIRIEARDRLCHADRDLAGGAGLLRSGSKHRRRCNRCHQDQCKTFRARFHFDLSRDTRLAEAMLYLGNDRPQRPEFLLEARPGASRVRQLGGATSFPGRKRGKRRRACRRTPT